MPLDQSHRAEIIEMAHERGPLDADGVGKRRLRQRAEPANEDERDGRRIRQPMHLRHIIGQPPPEPAFQQHFMRELQPQFPQIAAACHRTLPFQFA